MTNPVVHLEFHQISNRGKKLPAGADEFTEFLKSYIARWAGHAGLSCRRHAALGRAKEPSIVVGVGDS